MKKNKVFKLLSVFVKKTQEQRNQDPNTVRLDDDQIQIIVDSLCRCISQSSNKSLEDLVEFFRKEKQQRQDFFSSIVKIALTVAFVFGGVGLLLAVVSNWSVLWSGGLLQVLAVVIVLTYCVIFVILGIDIWRESDRNYLISIFSALVAFAALVSTLLK